MTKKRRKKIRRKRRSAPKPKLKKRKKRPAPKPRLKKRRPTRRPSRKKPRRKKPRPKPRPKSRLKRRPPTPKVREVLVSGPPLLLADVIAGRFFPPSEAPPRRSLADAIRAALPELPPKVAPPPRLPPAPPVLTEEQRDKLREIMAPEQMRAIEEALKPRLPPALPPSLPPPVPAPGKPVRKPRKPPVKAPPPVAIRVDVWTLIDRATEEGARRMMGRGHDGAASIAGNADGSIDAEVRVRAIPHGMKVNEILLDLEHSLRDLLGPGWPKGVAPAWISAGVRFPARPHEIDDEDFRKEYKVVRGLAEAFVHWQRQSKLAENFLTTRLIAKKLHAAGRLKPEQIIVRVHWNPDNNRPRRR